ncbi:PIN domain-containing protein [Sinorhizobium meliloti]|uniref:PIN domain-containing protein n=1 Tax=Rhizobium meliloti TaxID=382 RepID=UPI0004239C80|nr:PIN domain-containing protein [Sinorhizobium meliloti]
MNTAPTTSVTYCVDTNLLVEFIALGNIPWKKLAPTADLVRIIVPTKVGEEMDEHKNKSGRLRRRAIEFGQLSRRMEDSEDGVVVLREEGPRVTVEFGPLFRKSNLDADQFELEDSDNRVVAEVVAISRNVPGVALLADDSKPIRLARQAGLPYIRPLPEWRRQEGPDERDVEISDLKREIGAQPNLTLTIGDAGAQKRLVIEDGPGTIEEACSKAFANAVIESAPQVPRESLIKRHGLYSPGPFILDSGFHAAPGLRNSELDQYDEEYQRFMEMSEKVADGLHKALFKFGFARLIDIDVGNDGDRAGEKVLVEAEVTAPFWFLPTDSISRLLKSVLRAPTPPKPSKGIADLAFRGGNLREHLDPARIDIFHDHDEPETGGQSTYVSWRCEELRQDAHFDLPVLVVTDQPDARGLLNVTASSTVLAKKTSLQVPLEVSPMSKAAGPAYFLQRLGHIPEAYRKAFRTKLEALLNLNGG